MKKLLVILIFSISTSQHLKAQKANLRRIDSLKAIVASSIHDTVKFAAYSDLAQTYWSVNPTEGIPFAQKGLEIAKKLNKKKYLTQGYGILGMNYELISDHANGIKNLTKSLEIAKEINDDTKIGLAAGALGNVYYFQSNFPQAIDYFITSLKASEQAGNKREIAAALSNIGAIYLDLKELDKALPYFEKALKINKEIGFKNYQAINLGNIGNIYDEKNNFQLAKSYYLKGLKINQEINEIPEIASSFNSIAGCYYNLDKLDSAYEYINKSMTLTRQIQNIDDLAHSYRLLANIYYDAVEKNITTFIAKYGRNNKSFCLKLAGSYADSSITFNTKIENLDRLSKSYKIHSKIQLAMGNCAASLESFKKYKELNDSIYNIDVNNKLTQRTMQYEFDKKEAMARAAQEKKEAIAQAEKEKSTQQKIVLIIGLIAALGFAAWDYRQKKIISKQKKRSDELLLNILPYEVAEELKAKGSADAQLIDEVTVLFTDFKGFTQLSEKLSPTELVAEINECFSAFDYIMEKHKVEKIKTIGDAYMAAGGLPTSNTTHAVDVVNAALEIQKFMQDHKAAKLAANELFFEIRIGVHTGPVVAGIVGVKKFAYDIWGDTVNTASRMESSGEVGKVNISGTTYALVKDKFNCVHRGKVQAKGKGEVDMYFVENV
ncbi:MAG TPA: adenylate/guanylate cyclase domain-containing protein [Bacteroidia bacterium]|nr:adenylate/guanylate cyclase domain-containing protein [Bacteroidia bacterium]